MPRIRQSFICILRESAQKPVRGLDAWREGDLTFEEAMMEVVESLFLAKEELQRRLDYASSPNYDEPFVDPSFNLSSSCRWWRLCASQSARLAYQ